MIIMNEKIKAVEVQLTGVNGEDLGVMPTREALALAKKLKVDLVCTSLFSSPPPCKLIGAGAAKQQEQIARKQDKNASGERKEKEIRLTPQIEEHDYDTKKNQTERLLMSGNAVRLTVAIGGKEGPQAKALLERLLADLKSCGRPQTGIQLSGKMAQVTVVPKQ
ncbi:translation initiation factor IF-3 [Gorillibacterium massiliense]|uniref:translation initiation factor IF-3 n=1 Tax=Gorillibacterium massiliense TaxID=1280390 RepID=UPI0004AC74D7|nr:translation initiation factor IF-3 [Gorillibacterium massiliense]